MEESELKKEFSGSSNESIVEFIKTFNEEDSSKLQAAWEVLEERGIKDNILKELVDADANNNISLEELLKVDVDIPINDSLAEKIEGSVGKEIVVNRLDILGQIRNQTVREDDISKVKLTEEEKNRIKRKLLIELVVAAISFVLALIFIAINVAFIGKQVVEFGLLVHSFIHLALAYSNYRIIKND